MRDAVREIPLAFAKPGRERQPALEVLARNDLVEHCSTKNSGPFLEAFLVAAAGVGGVSSSSSRPQVPGFRVR